MKDSTLIKAFLASIIMLGISAPAGNAQSLFFGMMSEQSSEAYNPKAIREITDTQAAEKFKEISLNHDGVVTRNEFSAAYADLFPDDARGKLVDKRFRALDMKKNGRITQSEFVAGRNVLIETSYATNVTDDVQYDKNDTTANSGEVSSASMVEPAAGGASN